MEHQGKKCTRCKGSGTELCRACGGSGVQSIPMAMVGGVVQPEPIPCMTCGGTGHTNCYLCNGSGKI